MTVDIKVEFRPNVIKSNGYAHALDSMSFVLAVEMARSIKRRVSELGKPAQQFVGYAKYRPNHDHVISKNYVKRAHAAGIELKSGDVSFASSEEFHRVAGVIPGSFNTSGGMWRGLNVVSYGNRINKVEFRGRSQGKVGRVGSGWGDARPAKAPVLTKSGKRRKKRRIEKISNSKKAETVLQYTNVNVLSLTELEFSLIESRVVAGYVRDGVSSLCLAGIEWPKYIQSVRLTP
ncbi:MAG: hypothetical protein ACI9MR_000020 [Myxococcota bacterium]|jgi:hypothetical protein